MLFLTEKNIPVETISEFFNISEKEIYDILKELKSEKDCTGVNLQVKDGQAFLVSNPICGKVVNKFFSPNLKIKKLSKTSMETLTIIAFRGPVTKSQIEQIKGSSVDSSIQALIEKKLIHCVGVKKSLGNPKLYDVTDMFYKYLGFDSKEQLLEIDKAKWLKEVVDNENK